MADPNDYLRIIEELNRGPVQNRPATPPDLDAIRRKLRAPQAAPGQSAARAEAAPVTYRRDLPRVSPKPIAPLPLPGKPVALEEALPGEVVEGPRGGSAYLITSRIDGSDAHGAFLIEAFQEAFWREGSGLRRRLPEACRGNGLSLEALVFVDLETTGLGSSPLFLVGTMTWESGGLVTRQYLARDYSEEHAAIALFADDLRQRGLIVSFNGKSFDLPYLRVRAAANAVPLPPEPPHLDLLHQARRVWRHRLPDCKLQTLERHLCGRTRTGDIPGAEIPDAYHRFVRTNNAAEMVRIIEHNRLDLLTLAELMARLP